MKEFLKFSYDLNLHIGYFYQLIPLCLAENEDTLILATDSGPEAILYDWRNNRERSTTSINRIWWHNAKGYVQSLPILVCICVNSCTFTIYCMIIFIWCLWFDYTVEWLSILFQFSLRMTKHVCKLSMD
jgi:hypothetical protein